jgi:small subunit ribosomal protein S6
MNKTKYDLTLIIKGDKSSEEAQKIFDEVKAKLEKLNYAIEKSINPALRELTYAIQKQTQGYYGNFVFETDNYNSRDIEEMFKFDENVLRYLIVLINESVAKVRKNSRRMENIEKKSEVLEEKKEEIEEVDNAKEEVKEVKEDHEEKKEEEEKKAVDLEHLDEKLDELLNN